jgi:peroxiredoxin
VRLAWIGALVAIVASTALAGCGTGSGAVDQASGGARGFVAGDGTVTRYDAGERPKAPSLAGETLDGDEYRLEDARGSVVVLNFWGQWCAPCRAEADDLVGVYDATHAEGVEFLGINVRDSQDSARAFERSFHVPYPSLFDPAGRVALQFRETPPNAIPATIVIDRSGKVAAVIRKPLLQEDLEPVVREIASE